jgi:AhpD family alkylhydroperoxidase
MKQRLNYQVRKNGGIESMVATEAWLNANFDEKLLVLVRMRASQINGCAYCLHMHSEEARKLGESDDRLLLLDAWHESAMYTVRERAALAWTEALTKIADTHAPDDVYDQVRSVFSEDELISLSAAIAMINAWNRISIGFRGQHPHDRAKAAV